MSKRKMRVTFDAPGERWSAERDRESKERLASGWTSLRVSKKTARELRALTRKAGDLLGMRYGRFSPDELLAHPSIGVAITPAGDVLVRGRHPLGLADQVVRLAAADVLNAAHAISMGALAAARGQGSRPS